METTLHPSSSYPVHIPAGNVAVEADLTLPPHAKGVVLFAHGSGSSRHSPRNRFVASTLNQAGLATLLADLLTRDEERIDDRTAHLRFDIPFLAQRLIYAVRCLERGTRTAALPVGLFGASTGAGAALIAAAELPGGIRAVVSRGGRPDLAGEALARVRTPTLLIVGGLDDVVIELNERALEHLTCEKRLEIVPGATHLFEEPGTLERVAALARDWFARYLS